MHERDMLLLASDEVSSLLSGSETEVLESIRTAYEVHGRGDSFLPHSVFLNFPNDSANRIIALPAYLGGQVQTAGIKWIASFPANLGRGSDRASALIILNSAASGRPKAILEGSIISAKRTAASAALAARVLDGGRSNVAGIVGCGLINREIVGFLRLACPQIRTCLVYDLNAERAHIFKTECEARYNPIQVRIAEDMESILGTASLISFATSTREPHIHDIKLCLPGTVFLHISLRDVSPSVILSSDNVVDDVDHVCRAQTSIHLAEQQVRHREFIRCTLTDILEGRAVPRASESICTIFSPFGLGVLDIALAEYVFQKAIRERKGTVLTSFLPAPWKRVVAATV